MTLLKAAFFILFCIQIYAKIRSADQTCQCASSNISINTTTRSTFLKPLVPWPCTSSCLNCTWHVHIDYDNPLDVLQIIWVVHTPIYNWTLNIRDSKNNSHLFFYRGSYNNNLHEYATHATDLYLFFDTNSENGTYRCSFSIKSVIPNA